MSPNSHPAPHPHPRRALVLVVGGTLAVLALAVVVGEREGRAARTGRADDQTVVAEVPARGRDSLARQLDGVGLRLAAAPRDVALATQVAQLALRESRRLADPRLLGRAQAALAPWWQDPAPPARVLLLRAIIKQSRHDFEDALIDLDQLLADRPDDAQALLVRAVVLTVRGRYDEALATCRRLTPALGATSAVVAVACAAPALAALGQVQPALQKLEVVTASAALPSDAGWGHSLAGEIAFWAGQPARARVHLVQALALDPADGYSRTLLADLLIDQGRAAEVVDLLAGREADDGALLRLALAERQRGSARAAALIADLGERFAGARRRADFSHGREEARFALFLADDPERALERAESSWATQHEPWDARLVLAAAADLDRDDPVIREVAAFVRARGEAWVRALPPARAALPGLASGARR
jgi:tetratricopeptide (TPR) repeat protein